MKRVINAILIIALITISAGIYSCSLFGKTVEATLTIETLD